MKRRNFFKNLLATVFGFTLASKETAKADDDAVEELRRFLQEDEAARKPQTTLRFNENRIEAWNGEKWVMILEVLKVDEPPKHEQYFTLYIPSLTAEQKLKLDSRPINIKDLTGGVWES